LKESLNKLLKILSKIIDRITTIDFACCLNGTAAALLAVSFLISLSANVRQLSALFPFQEFNPLNK
jgi:hypothetical protein